MEDIREEALRVCRQYYQNNGYSEQHCHDYIDHLDDNNLKYAYFIILKEQEDAESKGFSVLS